MMLFFAIFSLCLAVSSSQLAAQPAPDLSVVAVEFAKLSASIGSLAEQMKLDREEKSKPWFKDAPKGFDASFLSGVAAKYYEGPPKTFNTDQARKLSSFLDGHIHCIDAVHAYYKNYLVSYLGRRKIDKARFIDSTCPYKLTGLPDWSGKNITAADYELFDSCPSYYVDDEIPSVSHCPILIKVADPGDYALAISRFGSSVAFIKATDIIGHDRCSVASGDGLVLVEESTDRLLGYGAVFSDAQRKFVVLLEHLNKFVSTSYMCFNKKELSIVLSIVPKYYLGFYFYQVATSDFVEPYPTVSVTMGRPHTFTFSACEEGYLWPVTLGCSVVENKYVAQVESVSPDGLAKTNKRFGYNGLSGCPVVAGNLHIGAHYGRDYVGRQLIQLYPLDFVF